MFTPDEDRLLLVNEVATMLRVHPDTVRRWDAEGACVPLAATRRKSAALGGGRSETSSESLAGTCLRAVSGLGIAAVILGPVGLFLLVAIALRLRERRQHRYSLDEPGPVPHRHTRRRAGTRE